MNRKYRLTKMSDFKRMRRKGTSYTHPRAVLIVAPNQLDRTRFGVTASRTVGGAVKRNRCKRRLRAAIKLHLARIDAGWDVILIARPHLDTTEWISLCEAIENLFSRAGLLREQNND